jgi:putative endonuclease
LHQYIENAIVREKEIKGWRREKKLELIRTINPNLNFLNNELFDEWPPKDTIHRKDIE